MEKYRNELKQVITVSDFITLRHRLNLITKKDEHTKSDGTYDVRSLYFDTPSDKALREKIDGLNPREKFRIRYYNGDLSNIQLEKKSKKNGLSLKKNMKITEQEVESIIAGELGWMVQSGRDLIVELYSKMQSEGLRPKTIVDYKREPFVYPPGNVRITLDYHIRTGLTITNFLKSDNITIPIQDDIILLEVKWDEFLPSIIRKAVGLDNRQSSAFSKYRACRIYG